MSTFLSAARSDVGTSRSNNEDYVLSAPAENIWILADGVGGHDAGEIASEIACHTIMDKLSKNRSVEEAIISGHQAILSAPSQGKGKKGMASTVVLFIADESKGQISWVGDSRAYKISSSSCEQLTKDHSLVQRLVDTGKITESEAQVHPSKNVVLQVLGMEPATKLEISSVQVFLESGDKILLCSDGLSDTLSKQTLFNTINSSQNLNDALEKLIELAKANGAKDNITALIVEKLAISRPSIKTENLSQKTSLHSTNKLITFFKRLFK